MAKTVYCLRCGLVEPPHHQHLAPSRPLGHNVSVESKTRKDSTMWNFLPRKMLMMPIIRHGLTGVGGWLTGAGLATSQEAAAIVGGLIALTSVVWGLFEKRSDLEKINGNGH